MNFFLLDPLEQFLILPLSFSFFDSIVYFFYGHFLTNFFVYLLLGFGSGIYFFCSITCNNNLIPKTSWEHLSEISYQFIYGVVIEQMFHDYYFSFLYVLFFFILFSNLIGLTPYGFTTTSFIFFTFILGCGIFFGCVVLGFWLHGKKFAKHFVPKNIPSVLIPFLVFIEVVSFCCRPLSLSVRLFANMMAGHSLLNILSGFSFSLAKKSVILGIIPFFIVLLIAFLELGIAVLQAYIFLVLTAIYLNDSFRPHI